MPEDITVTASFLEIYCEKIHDLLRVHEVTGSSFFLRGPIRSVKTLLCYNTTLSQSLLTPSPSHTTAPHPTPPSPPQTPVDAGRSVHRAAQKRALDITGGVSQPRHHYFDIILGRFTVFAPFLSSMPQLYAKWVGPPRTPCGVRRALFRVRPC